MARTNAPQMQVGNTVAASFKQLPDFLLPVIVRHGVQQHRPNLFQEQP